VSGRVKVFPAGRMCSIRRAMVLWLLPVFLLVGIAGATVSYFSHARMVSMFMDEQMQQLASALSDNDHIQPMPLSEERVFKWGAYVVQTYSPRGDLQVSSWPDLPVGKQGATGFHDVHHDGRTWRVYTMQPTRPDGNTVQVVQNEGFRSKLAAERAGGAILPLLLLLPLSLLVLWLVARAMSRALHDIAQQVARQDEHAISELNVDNVPSEIAPLVTSFNALLRRLRDAFATQRRFVQDAAHELRTPIAALALQLENMRQDVTCEAAADRFSHMESGIRRAQRLVDQLLRLSKQESAGADGPAIVDLRAQLHESVNTLIGLADQRHIDLGLVAPEQPSGPLTLNCAAGDLRSLLDNLIEYALRYKPEGGVVDVRVLNDDGRVCVEVVDTGPGIPQELLPRVFDRFFRVPGTGANGSGLGLSIAQAAAQRAGLMLTLRNRQDRSGLIARIEPAV
jgi:signal transduction histidine kinase